MDACANPEASTPAPDQAAAPDDPYEAERFNPFISYAFLTALETSKSVGRGPAGPAHIFSSRIRAAVSPPPRQPI